MKLERMMAITILLLNRKRVQAQELADKMEVSLRTIYRDLESLNMAGIPIVSYTGSEGGYEIMDSFRLDRQMLSFDELISLSTALRGLKSTQAVEHTHMDRLLDKVGALVTQAEQGKANTSEQVLVDFTPWRNNETEKIKYESLQAAVQGTKLIKFGYTDGKGEETERHVEPIGLVLKGYSWYLHAYCLTRQDYRIFRLSRVQNLLLMPDTFIRRDVSLAELNKRMERPHWTNNGRSELTLQFLGDAKVAAVDHFNDDSIEKLPDGSLLVHTSLPDGKWLLGFLLQYGTNVIVHKPTKLAADIRQTALQIASLYQDSGQLTERKDS
ncbi:YafY family transcriptional regulator [Paenibacillus sp. N1-5-1-14]|uniref:helix-turn-helix transcriptional regulator n=1 Tax=Paenibacillus radicibacter TaxID=2972488 RepID=UPI0021596859|nr:YafY family protein [Paenibacillus radicibacter]MCR8642877.1 YafY family transcriptional regulator [Paenibacillus radicibacter]